MSRCASKASTFSLFCKTPVRVRTPASLCETRQAAANLQVFEHGVQLLVAEGATLLLRCVEERDLLELHLQVAEEGHLELGLGCMTRSDVSAISIHFAITQCCQWRTNIALAGCVVRRAGHGLDTLLEDLVVEPEGRPFRVALQDLL
jgi:hypothetical protein